MNFVAENRMSNGFRPLILSPNSPHDAKIIAKIKNGKSTMVMDTLESQLAELIRIDIHP
jgi:hypothetical protein